MFEPSVPRFTGNINFNAQHSPAGAFMSFTCGHVGAGGGIGVEVGKPAGHNLFVGVKRGTRNAQGPIRCLPFVRGTEVPGPAHYDVEHARPAPAVDCYGPDEVERHYGWATDTWTTPDLSFSIYTPFGSLREPGDSNSEAQRLDLLPAVVATLRIDNRKGTVPKTGVFAIDFVEPGARILRADGDPAGPRLPRRVGFAWRRSMGVMGTLEGTDAAADALEPLQRWSVAEALGDVNPVHELGTCAGLSFEVPPGEQRTLVLAIGVYLDGIVTSGLEARYYYTRCYASLKDVLETALERSADLRARAGRLDVKLVGSGLSAAQQFLIAHSTRSYYGSTQLLEVGGQPFWVVNEGEYCMMNTLDLAVDHVFWELKHNPWVVRNLLDNYVRYYSYYDELNPGSPSGPVNGNGNANGAARAAAGSPGGGQKLPGGLTFCHDMGAHNNFSRFGHSSYELPNLTGCFSYMSAEQLCNWVLLAACYLKHTGDVDWARQHRATIEACGQSMLNRGGTLGFAQHDSSRCCANGAEITTYDSLDHSLAQTRNNLYMAVKSWAAYLGLRDLFAASGDGRRDARDAAAEDWTRHAGRVADAVVAHVADDGTIPAVFEADSPGFASRILPAIEGLVYPLFWRDIDALRRDGPFGNLLSALRRHTIELLGREDSPNLFPDGGIKLSSTSDNSWMSKIALFQYVARELFQLDRDPKFKHIFDRADSAHVRWQTDGSAFWACCDQIIRGEAKGSRYYPRIVTTALWLDESRRPVVQITAPKLPKPTKPVEPVLES